MRSLADWTARPPAAEGVATGGPSSFVRDISGDPESGGPDLRGIELKSLVSAKTIWLRLPTEGHESSVAVPSREADKVLGSSLTRIEQFRNLGKQDGRRERGQERKNSLHSLASFRRKPDLPLRATRREDVLELLSEPAQETPVLLRDVSPKIGPPAWCRRGVQYDRRQVVLDR